MREYMAQQQILSDWEKWLDSHPSEVNAIWHDPAAQMSDLRIHNTLLHLAVLGDIIDGDRAELVELLLKRKANPDVQNDEGDTPLHLACKVDTLSVQIAQLLLQYGANPNIRNSNGYSPLNLVAARTSKYLQISELLLNNGAELDLNSALALGRIENVTQILEQNGLVDAPFPEQALINAIDSRSHECVSLLLNYLKNSPTLIPPDALCRAIEVNQPQIVRLLLEHGTDPHLKCDDTTALDYARGLERDPSIIQMIEDAMNKE